MASGLVTAALLAVGGVAIALTGPPAAPPPCGVLAGGATVTGLRPARPEPALAPLEQAAAAIGVPTVRVGRLTRPQGAGRLETAHGRSCSRAVRRREGGTSRRPFAPTVWTAVVGSRAARILQITCTGACLPGTKRREKRAKAAIDRSRNGSTGSAIMAQCLAAADRIPGQTLRVCLRSRGGCPVGCSVSTNFGKTPRIGAHRAPYKSLPRQTLIRAAWYADSVLPEGVMKLTLLIRGQTEIFETEIGHVTGQHRQLFGQIGRHVVQIDKLLWCPSRYLSYFHDGNALGPVDQTVPSPEGAGHGHGDVSPFQSLAWIPMEGKPANKSAGRITMRYFVSTLVLNFTPRSARVPA